MRFPPQLRVSPAEPTRHSPRPDHGAIPCKPPQALWTSTYTGPVHGSDWVQWCLDEDFSVPESGAWRSWLLVPNVSARVYIIDTLSDLVRLIGRFPNSDERLPDFFRHVPDWAKVSEQYDAVHLTEVGQWRTRFGVPSMYGWDCESTAWLRWMFHRVVDLGSIAYERLGADEESAS